VDADLSGIQRISNPQKYEFSLLEGNIRRSRSRTRLHTPPNKILSEICRAHKSGHDQAIPRVPVDAGGRRTNSFCGAELT